MHCCNTCLVNCPISNTLLLDSLHILLNTGLTTLLSGGQRASFYTSLTKHVFFIFFKAQPDSSHTATKSTMNWASLLHLPMWFHFKLALASAPSSIWQCVSMFYDCMQLPNSIMLQTCSQLYGHWLRWSPGHGWCSPGFCSGHVCRVTLS